MHDEGARAGRKFDWDMGRGCVETCQWPSVGRGRRKGRSWQRIDAQSICWMNDWVRLRPLSHTCGPHPALTVGPEVHLALSEQCVLVTKRYQDFLCPGAQDRAGHSSTRSNVERVARATESEGAQGTQRSLL
jgi:hypothetical protein